MFTVDIKQQYNNNNKQVQNFDYLILLFDMFGVELEITYDSWFSIHDANNDGFSNKEHSN